ncbi:hypothetical protein MMC21_004956 [Puttea exsequens]|nr:hypothetical protein [Puttea exsequens]
MSATDTDGVSERTGTAGLEESDSDDDTTETPTKRITRSRLDYRKLIPSSLAPEDKYVAQIQCALDLTHIDFSQRQGCWPPTELIEKHKQESYIFQWRYLQGLYKRTYKGGELEASQLCQLPAWDGGLSKRKASGLKGRELLEHLRETGKLERQLASEIEEGMMADT